VGRTYRPVRKDSNGHLKYYGKREWNCSAWVASFYGHILHYLNLPTDAHYTWGIYTVLGLEIQLIGHIIKGEDFQKIKDKFSKITDAEILEALLYAAKKADLDAVEKDPEKWVKNFRKDFMSFFSKDNVIAFISDYVTLEDLEKGKEMSSYHDEGEYCG
jgi:hypothetical protein